jgi:hypothetical protein
MDSYASSRAGDHDSLAGQQAHSLDERVIRRAERVREDRPLRERDGFREGHEVLGWHERVFGISAGSLSADVSAEALTYGFASPKALAAPAAGQVQGAGHPITDAPAVHSTTDGRHFSGNLMPQDERHRGGSPSARANGNVEVIDGASPYPQADIPGARFRDRKRAQVQRPTELLEYERPHRHFLSEVRRPRPSTRRTLRSRLSVRRAQGRARDLS